MTRPDAATPILVASGVSNSFGPVAALRDASLRVGLGEIVALMGANGAGKSTLVKILTGALQPNGGTIRINGRDSIFASPAAARRGGLVPVYQEPSLIPDLTVGDNLRLGQTPKDEIWARDKTTLYRYRSSQREHRTPVLLVMSLVSKAYIFDLRPGSSFVEVLLGKGLDVFVLDWGVPDRLDAENTFETYCDDYLTGAVRATCDEAGSDGVTLLGYWLGSYEFVRNNIEAALVLIVAVSLLPVVIEWLNHRRERRSQAQTETAE